VVIDTNIALDLLVFDNPDCLPLAAALAASELRWLATASMRDELERVLGYPLIAARLARGNLAPQGVLPLLDVEDPTRQKRASACFGGSPEADPPHEP